MIGMSIRLWAGAACMLGAFAGTSAHPGTLDDVKARGTLRCGVAPNSPGFAAQDAQGKFRGFDVDFCRAIAAAVLGDAGASELTPLGLREAFATLTAGSVDVLTHRFTWTFNRDNGAGIETVLPVFYDGQGFIVRKSAGIKSLKELNGATICVTQGSTTELNLADYFRSHKLTYQLATFADPDETRNAYDAGRCDAWTNDRGSLAARSQALKNRADNVMLPETISKEPIGPMVKTSDTPWFHIVRWTSSAVIAAEELGREFRERGRAAQDRNQSRSSSACSASATISARSSDCRRTGPTTSSSRSEITARSSSAMSAKRPRLDCRAASTRCGPTAAS